MLPTDETGLTDDAQKGGLPARASAGGIRTLQGKLVAEHGKAALRRLAPCFVLDHVPVLGQNSILDANDVRYNPVDRLPNARISPVHDYKISVGDNRSVLILQRRRDTLDKSE